MCCLLLQKNIYSTIVVVVAKENVSESNRIISKIVPINLGMKSSSNTNLLTAIGVKRSRTVDKNISNSTTNTNTTKSSTRDIKSRTRRVQSISISTPLTNTKSSAAKSSSTNTNTNKKQNNNNDVFVVDLTNIDSSSPATMAQNRSQRALSHMLCWEGPPAHFMLPTHAIHCRSSRSVERCPRACKGTSSNPLKSSLSLFHIFTTDFSTQVFSYSLFRPRVCVYSILVFKC